LPEGKSLGKNAPDGAKPFLPSQNLRDAKASLTHRNAQAFRAHRKAIAFLASRTSGFAQSQTNRFARVSEPYGFRKALGKKLLRKKVAINRLYKPQENKPLAFALCA